MKKLWLSLTLFIGLNSVINAQADSVLILTLGEAQAIAIANNFTLKDNKLDTEIARGTVQETISTGLPQVTGSVNYTNNPLLQPSVLPGELNFENPGTPFAVAFGTTHTSRFGADLDQLLFDGTYLLGIKAAQDFVLLREKREKLTERDIRFDVARAYMGALISQENIDILDKNISNLEKLRTETLAIYEAGFTEQLDVDRLTLSLANVKTQKKNLARLKELNYNILKNTMSVSSTTELVLEDRLSELEKELEQTTLLFDDPVAWPEYEVLAIQEGLENKNIRRYRLDYLPKLRGFASYGRFGQDEKFGNVFYDGDSWSSYFNFGVNLSIPIFDGNFKKAKIRQATATRDKVTNQLELLDQTIDIAVSNARIAYQNALAQVESQKDNIALAQKIYDVTQIKYREGVGSSIELSQAEQELYTTQQNYINALYDLLIAKVDLEKALGK